MSEKSLYQQIIDDFMKSVEENELITPEIRRRLEEQLAEERPLPDRKELVDSLTTEE